MLKELFRRKLRLGRTMGLREYALILGRRLFQSARLPLQRWIYIEVTRVCNLKCKFCAYPKVAAQGSREVLGQSDFAKRITQAVAAGFSRIGLTPTVGDVFVDKGFMSKLQYLEDAEDVDAYRFTTNLILPNQNDVMKLFSLRKLQILGISVYGHNEETFRQLTKANVNAYQRLLKNLEVLSEIDTLKFRVSVGLRTTKSFIGIYQDNSAMSIMLRNLIKRHANVTVNCNEWYDNWGGLISQKDVEGIDIEIPSESEVPKAGVCSLIFHKNLVAANGDVIACACRDVHGELKIGNSNRGGLSDILSSNNKTLVALVKRQEAGDFPSVCRSCTAYSSIYAQSNQHGFRLSDWLNQ